MIPRGVYLYIRLATFKSSLRVAQRHSLTAFLTWLLYAHYFNIVKTYGLCYTLLFMKTLFLGQLGLRAGMGQPKSSREQRLEMLGRALVDAGHSVTILGTKPFTDATITNFHGIQLRLKPSLNPEKAGGWLYIVASLLTLWRQQPSVAHIHSWRMAALVSIAALLSPETKFVWTIDALPRQYHFVARLIARQAHRVCDSITVPTRVLQYQLLTAYRVSTYYIPDGYVPPVLKDLPLKTFSLRNNQYTVLLATNPDHIKSAIRAYATLKTAKKLVILSEPSVAWQRLLHKKSFVYFIGHKTGRQLHTLIRHAHAVIAYPEPAQLDVLLQAMDSGRRIVAANDPLFQETLGLTATYFNPSKVKDITDALQFGLKQANVRGIKARTRAQNHFTWKRIVPEYLTLYRHNELAVVPIDSARQFAYGRTGTAQ